MNAKAVAKAIVPVVAKLHAHLHANNNAQVLVDKHVQADAVKPVEEIVQLLVKVDVNQCAKMTAH